MSDFTAAMASGKDWYWISADGKRIFSGARCAVVASDDAAYRAWLAARPVAAVIPKGTTDEDGQPEFTEVRQSATPWPRDEAGQDSDAEMDAVLLRYGLSLAGPVHLAYGDDLITALSDAELSAMSGGTLRDQRMLSAQRVQFRATDEVIVRLAAVMKIDPVAWLARVPV